MKSINDPSVSSIMEMLGEKDYLVSDLGLSEDMLIDLAMREQ